MAADRAEPVITIGGEHLGMVLIVDVVQALIYTAVQSDQIQAHQVSAAEGEFGTRSRTHVNRPAETHRCRA